MHMCTRVYILIHLHKYVQYRHTPYIRYVDIEDICWLRLKIEFNFTSGQKELIFSRVAATSENIYFFWPQVKSTNILFSYACIKN